MKGLDTNLLVRFLVQDDPDQSARVGELIDECVAAGEAVFLNGVVLCEAVWVLESGYGHGRDVLADVLEKILLTRQFEVEDRDGIWRALEAFRQGEAGFADYLIGERNRACGCDATATFDRALEGAPGFEVL